MTDPPTDLPLYEPSDARRPYQSLRSRRVAASYTNQPPMPIFYDETALGRLAESDRLHQVLIRFHEGRLQCAAQYAHEIIRRLEASGWTCRDVSDCAGTKDKEER